MGNLTLLCSENVHISFSFLLVYYSILSLACAMPMLSLRYSIGKIGRRRAGFLTFSVALATPFHVPSISLALSG